MNEYSIKITPQANEQMQEIFRYISKTLCVPDTALRLLDELKKGFHASSFDRDYYYIAAENRLPDAVIIETNRHVAVDFYRRFAKRVRSMMEHAPQYELICFTGP